MSEHDTMPTPELAPDRNAIRAKIFGAKATNKVIDFFGAKVEVRQPAVGDILESTDVNDDVNEAVGEKTPTMLRAIIRGCYVPGTNDRVFDDADVEGLKTLPFGKELTLLTNTIQELMGVDLEAGKKKAKEE